jgi:hypothetical protein
VKIQVTTKILPNIVNHIIEFIILKDGTFHSKTKYATNDIYVQVFSPVFISRETVSGGKWAREAWNPIQKHG